MLKQALTSAVATAARLAAPLPTPMPNATSVCAVTRTAVGVSPLPTVTNVPSVSTFPSVGVTAAVDPMAESLRSRLWSASDCRLGLAEVIWDAVRPSSSRARSSAITSASACMSRRADRCMPRSTTMAATAKRATVITIAVSIAIAPRSSSRLRMVSSPRRPRCS